MGARVGFAGPGGRFISAQDPRGASAADLLARAGEVIE